MNDTPSAKPKSRIYAGVTPHDVNHHGKNLEKSMTSKQQSIPVLLRGWAALISSRRSTERELLLTAANEIERLRRATEFVVYSNCDKHQGIWATMTIVHSPPPKVICPICEPPK